LLASVAILFCGHPRTIAALNTAGAAGIFEGASDIGEAVHPGTVHYDAAAKTYTVTAAGENMWSTRDAFYFVWKRVSGDIELTADIAFPREGGRPHRKAALVLKQDLSADGVYADAAVHGSGMTALQYRVAKGATTQDIELNIDLPRRVRIVKRGAEITMFLSMHGEALHQAGATIRLRFDDPFYIGIGVCSHEKDVTETAVFSNLELKHPEPIAANTTVLFSALQTIQTEDNFRRSMMVRTIEGRIGSANWTADGQTLYFNQDGQIKKMAALGGPLESLNIGPHLWCDDNHGLSPDNQLLAASCAEAEGKPSSIYVVSLVGGQLQRLTLEGSAEFHGWSADGTTIAFTGTRDGHSDVYVIPAQGGEEKRLTASAKNDGPDFGPDGYVYFNSDRSGSMQIWRMKADGTMPEQLTREDAENWFPHVSPNGQQMVYLSYRKGAPGHSTNENVALQIMDLSSRRSRLLVSVLGGEGTLNAPSWSHDNHHLAFTGYELLPADSGGPEFPMVPPKPDVPAK